MSMADVIALTKLPTDLKKAADTMGREEARYLVDTYYQMQNNRMASTNQNRDLVKAEEPHQTIGFFADQFRVIEAQIKGALEAYAKGDPLGRWCLENYGIGPVITAGLLAHIDISKAPTVGHIWRFAGLDPTTVWLKGQKRPHNADLKVLCWKIGESFKKFSGKEDCFYGKIYRQRKEYEVTRNNDIHTVPDGAFITSTKDDETIGTIAVNGEVVSCYQINGVWFYGGNAKWAHHTLTTKNIKDADTLARYREGRLPDGRLDLRSTRYAAKLFLSHYHAEAYKQMGQEPPLPYPIAHLGHVDMIYSPIGRAA